MNSRRLGEIDYQLLALTSIILGWGWVMVYSSSAIMADQQFKDSYYFLKRQLFSSGLGLALMIAFSRMHYQRLREWIKPMLAVTALLLIAVLFAPRVAGVKRWIRLGFLSIQPAEIAKLTVVIFLADYLDRKRSKVSRLVQGAVIPWMVVGMILALISLEPDFGTPALLFSVGLLMLFIGGMKLRYLAGTFACALPVLAYELIRFPYRRKRLLNFLDPFGDAQGTGYQLVQSLYAVGSGGWFGRGLGNSKLKLMYLPAAHTDFIFPILCEELGLAGSLAMLSLFILFFLRGIRIARHAPDLFGMLLAAGLTFTIGLQAFFNVAMSIGLMPTKGLPLPFFSYGRWAMIVALMSVGILLNISRHIQIKGTVHR